MLEKEEFEFLLKESDKKMEIFDEMKKMEIFDEMKKMLEVLQSRRTPNEEDQ